MFADVNASVSGPCKLCWLIGRRRVVNVMERQSVIVNGNDGVWASEACMQFGFSVGAIVAGPINEDLLPEFELFGRDWVLFG
jgi:hypothetical protein